MMNIAITAPVMLKTTMSAMTINLNSETSCLVVFSSAISVSMLYSPTDINVSSKHACHKATSVVFFMGDYEDIKARTRAACEALKPYHDSMFVMQTMSRMPHHYSWMKSDAFQKTIKARAIRLLNMEYAAGFDEYRAAYDEECDAWASGI
jgi:hypothetical protein